MDFAIIAIHTQIDKLKPIKQETIDRFFSTSKKQLEESKNIKNQETFIIIAMSDKLQNFIQATEKRLQDNLNDELKKFIQNTNKTIK